MPEEKILWTAEEIRDSFQIYNIPKDKQFLDAEKVKEIIMDLSTEKGLVGTGHLLKELGLSEK